MSQTLQYGTQDSCTCRQPMELPRAPNAVLRAAQTVAGKIHRWMSRSRQRQALLDLDDHLLKDLGLSRAALREEAMKRFWM